MVHKYFNDWMFYVIYVLLAAIYFASLAMIAMRSRIIEWSLPALSIFLMLLFMIHCVWIIAPYVKSILPLFSLFKDNYLTHGMANQYILDHHLEAAVFGSFLILSIACFIYKREIISILCAVFAATIAPSYVLHVAILTIIYMALLITEKQYRRAMILGGLSALLIMPIFLYYMINFQPTNAFIFNQAQSIFANIRVPHHANISTWFSWKNIIQILIVLLAASVSFSNRRLFIIITVSALVSLGLSIIQILTNNPSLALLFPWRLSAWLVPLSTAILLAYCTSWIVQLIKPFIKPAFAQVTAMVTIGLSLLPMGLVSYSGLNKTITFAHWKNNDHISTYAKEHANVGQRYLIPSNYQRFRLASGQPVFVDWKACPFKDVEIVEWYRRNQLVHKFYTARNNNEAIRALNLIQQTEPVTHVIVDKRRAYLLDAIKAEPLYKGRRYIVAKLK